MTAAQVKFGIFVVLVLGLPASLMASGTPDLVELGKLVMILSPAVVGLALNFGLGDKGRKPDWRGVGWAAVITLAIVSGALAAAALGGALSFAPNAAPIDKILAASGASALTSVLEELGWAGGGLSLAIAALGRRWGVLVLGLVWAAWHLVPTFLHVGLFPQLEAAPPAMIVVFVLACLAYRELLTVLRERASTWLAAAAAHAAPNIILAGLITAGLGVFDATRWPLFPAPGGVVFLGLTGIAILVVSRMGQARPPA